jgi:hypothetical protein
MNEAFEKWMESIDFDNHQPNMRETFYAGAAAMREKAAEVADKNYMIAMCDLGEDWFEYSTDIATAIRKLEVG